MHLGFATPQGAWLAAALVLPLAALWLSERRARRTASTLSLRRQPWLALLPVAVAAAAVPGLLGLAAAQPVMDVKKTRFVRSDAEVFFVFDTSRSMLASAGRGAPTRFDRARTQALALRGSLSDFRVGIASLTDRMLPHVFPTASRETFRSTLLRALGVERPPPSRVSTRATSYYPLSSLATQNYFEPGSKKRLVVVFTDGEGTPFDYAELASVFKATHMRTIFIRYWSPKERIYLSKGKIESYRPDVAAQEGLVRAASALHAGVYTETDLGGALAAARRDLGSGPRERRGTEQHPVALAPYAVAGALLPLGFFLWRRNL
jgi:hypothetical protein